MTDSYLDITKSVMISSPAGSGKTEKLARRYIALLKNGSDVARILAITFTDKAAAEMKERILNILKKEDLDIFERVKDKIPRMRISTIHSFCLKLLKRFCIELGIDPSLEVMDSFNADILWSESVYESLLEDNLSGDRLFYEIIRDSGIRGWGKLYGTLQELHSNRPDIELGMRGMGIDFGIQSSESGEKAGAQDPKASHFGKILSLYSKCLNRYMKKKSERHLLDYNDLELTAYEAIYKNPEWQNVLFSFDEHTDHILVDEFQDTSSLQWKIIDKLTEEWRSGLGSKKDSGINPTIFLVGDDKQSIYSFRGANVNIFKNAREKLREWLGKEYHFIEVTENYRSLPAIVNFVNSLFIKLMPKGLYDDLRIEYTPFEATRQGEGSVDLMVFEGSDNIKNSRKIEASAISAKIKELYGKYDIYENDYIPPLEKGDKKDFESSGGKRRTCNYGDMAVLLRSRTHLSAFEDALRREGIPFVVVKGIGFYNTPEVTLLKDILFFLIDPVEDYSLFNILRSPIFSLEYETILDIIRMRSSADSVNSINGTAQYTAIPSLYAVLQSVCRQEYPVFPIQGDLWGKKPQSIDTKKLQDIMNSVNNWVKNAKETPYAIMLETILNDTGAWHLFHEGQRYVNVKKFIRLVEEFESRGLSGLEIREKLIKASARSDESKANVNTEGMNAVKIITIHASKGLQYPMVFLPCLDEENRTGTDRIAIDDNGDKILIAYEDDSVIRKTIPIFQKHKEKVQEEEKRLFYVAATRAMDYLYMSGILKETPSGKIAYLFDAFNLGVQGKTMRENLPFRVNIVKGENMPDVKKFELEETPGIRTSGLKGFYPSDIRPRTDEIIFTDPIDKDYKPALTWLDVTEEIDLIRKRHGDDWIILGRAFHRLFEGISKAATAFSNIKTKIPSILRNESVSDKVTDTMKDLIMSDVQRLHEAGHLREIIMPQENSFAELPFVLQRGSRVYRGRIDRVILKGNTALVYDYKTYPVSESELKELSERYSSQMEIYKDAVEKLFSMNTEAYLFFTHESRLIRVF